LELGQMVSSAKKYGFPVVVLTNSSLLHFREVREALSSADIVSAKLDAPDQQTFVDVNKPMDGLTFDSILNGLVAFRKEFSGKLALQMMFIKANQKTAENMARLACRIQPDEIQLDTPLRPSSVLPLSESEMAEIEKHFGGLSAISVYKEKKPKVTPLDLRETRKRRPEK